MVKDLCPKCYDVYTRFFTSDSTPVSLEGKESVYISDLKVADRDPDCPLCTFFFKLSSEAAGLASLPGAARFGMYSIHVSKFSWAFFDTNRRRWSLGDDDPAVFFIAPLFSFGAKARDWALRYNTCFMPLETKLDRILARELRPRADLHVVRQWAQYCNHCHTHEDCNALGRPQSAPDFTVIDCEKRELVVLQAPSPYITLSYVWGAEPAQASSDDGRLPERLPRLIEDAISVTVSLGYRYLWIDRYCIDETTKATLIRTMDRIYSESSLTIIASASEQPSQGLIGVSRDWTRLPHTFHLETLGLTQIFTSLAREVENSRWNTRAWTYQEGFLSNRRLVFTQSQCYFECGEMSCTEGLHVPLDKIASLSDYHLRMDKVFRWVADKHPLMLSQSSNRRYEAEVYFIERVREYMKRDLTHDLDAFDAFAGVLNYLEHFATEFLLGTISGLPIWSLESRWSRVGCGHEALLYSLTWSICRPCDDSTKDSEQVCSERRHELPSWTWCGWKFPTAFFGQIEWRQIPKAGSICLPVELSVEYQGSEPVRWPKLSNPVVLLGCLKEAKARYVCARGMLSELVIPANCWYANYDGECQCGPYRLQRRDVQCLSTAATRRSLDLSERGYILTAWFCRALDFNTVEDNCRTEAMILVPTSTPHTYERLDIMCQIKMEYFVTRPSVEAMAQRFKWTVTDFRIG